MNVLSLRDLLELADARVRHFRMESGYHSALWFDLDGLFAHPHRIARYLDALAERLRPHELSVLCGPLLGGAFAAMGIAERLGAEFLYAIPADTGDAALFSARYRLPRALERRVRERRIALVDDVMSAGSSLRATRDAVEGHGGQVVAIGALLVLGGAGRVHFTERGCAVESVLRDQHPMWPPDDCPLCREGIPVESPGDS